MDIHGRRRYYDICTALVYDMGRGSQGLRAALARSRLAKAHHCGCSIPVER